MPTALPRDRNTTLASWNRVLGRYNGQSAGGIALVHNGHAAGPQGFIHQQGHALDDNGFQQSAGQVDRAVSSHNEGILSGIQMGPACHNGQLHKAGQDGGQCRTPDTHDRCAEVSENQNVVAHQIDCCCRNSGNHWYKGIAGFLQRAGIGVGQGKGKETPDHDVQVLKTVAQNLCGLCRITFTGEVQSDEETVSQQEEGDTDGRNCSADENFETEGMADTFVIAGAVELGGEDTRTGAGTEDTKVEYEDQTVDNGNTAHRHGADLTHHDIVQHRNEVGNTHLNNNGNRH